MTTSARQHGSGERSRARYLGLSPAVMADCFGRSSFALRHELVAHPLVAIEALAELADSLPPDAIEQNTSHVGDLEPGGRVRRSELPAGEIVRTIETNDCWIVLPIRGAPAYAELYEALFDEIRPLLPTSLGSIVMHQAVFFLATGGSTTPAHIDLDHGLLLHLRGEKEVQIGDFPDRATQQRKIEAMHLGEHRNLLQLPQSAQHVELAPGDGVHIPAFMPHVVRTAPGQVSLSLAVSLKAEATMRESAVYRANGRLRRLGLRPQAPGVSLRKDRIKQRLVETIGGVRGRRAS